VRELSKYPPIRRGHRGGTVLVVDEDGELRRSLMRRLRAGGCRVFGADAAEDALYECLRHAVDVVVAAERLRGLDGLELCDVLRERGGPPVVLIADGGSASDRASLLDAGAAGCVDRREGSSPLAARVRAVLRQRSP
jgi:DNA-binding response OmpR family regulator